MCGIAGIISPDPAKVTSQHLKAMTDALAHRGPDGEAAWIDEAGNAGLGHRRLCIIDLSPAAAQPMHYLDRYAIIHNGEIYNYIELREVLRQKGYQFHTASDTEVMLAAYDCWKEDCVLQFEGMFAFAVWDKKEQTLFAARDRFGEKPFFYAVNDNRFLFASEMKALWTAGIEKEMCDQMLLYYLALGYSSPPPNSVHTGFYKHITSLRPGWWLRLSLKNWEKSVVYSQPYYRLDFETPNNGISETEAIAAFNEKFSDSIRRRLRSDVPLGTCLSGGIDSSSIAARVKALRSVEATQKTFSAVFPGFEKDESSFIDLFVKEKNIENFQVVPNAEEFISSFEKLLYHQEEPIGSSSIFAQYKIFELAKKNNVTVLLDGQGADELLGGYHKYIHWYLQELVGAKKLGSFIKEKHALKRNGIDFRWGFINYGSALLAEQTAKKRFEKKLIQLMHQPDITDAFKKENVKTVNFSVPPVNKLNDVLHQSFFSNGLEELLRYADRNSMAHGREVRLPFLDHNLVEFVFSLPSGFKIHNGWTKWLLRKAMENELPPEINWRKDKVGFEPPQQQWMESKILQEYVHEAKRLLVHRQVLKPAVLNKKVQPKAAHVADNFDWRYLVAGTLLH